MRLRSGFPTLGYVLFGLLVLSAAALKLGDREKDTYPSAMSVHASGVKAYADLLARAGYRVRIDRHPEPMLEAGDVAILFRVWPRKPWESPPKDPLFGARKAVVLSVQRDFQDAAAAARGSSWPLVSTVGSATDATVTLAREAASGDSGAGGTAAPSGPTDDSLTLWQVVPGGAPFAEYSRFRDREQVYVPDGLGATNRYIVQHDNAAVFAALPRTLTKPGGTVVFVEASVGNVLEASLLEKVGLWALGAWWQLILLGVVVAYTLGKRFGIADALPFRQRGTRELVDALGDLYRRGQATHVALAALGAECDRLVRDALKLGRDASPAARNALLPEELGRALALCDAAATAEPPPSPAAGLRIARDLEQRTREFVGKAGSVRRRRPAR